MSPTVPLLSGGLLQIKSTFVANYKHICCKLQAHTLQAVTAASIPARIDPVSSADALALKETDIFFHQFICTARVRVHEHGDVTPCTCTHAHRHSTQHAHIHKHKYKTVPDAVGAAPVAAVAGAGVVVVAAAAGLFADGTTGEAAKREEMITINVNMTLAKKQ